MEEIKSRRFPLLHIFLPLFFASLIYLLFRSEHIAINQLILQTSLSNFFIKVRAVCAELNTNQLSIYIYSLPSSLWLYSAMSAMLILWNNEINRKNFIWFFLPFLFSISLELMQKLRITDGTFDSNDFYLYLLTFIVFFILHRKKTRLGKIENNEIKKHWKALAGSTFFISIVIFSDYI